MVDISRQTVNINCPKCEASLTVSLKQVANEVTIKCNCGTDVQLVDSNGSAKKSIRDINGAFKDLENTIKSFGK